MVFHSCFADRWDVANASCGVHQGRHTCRIHAVILVGFSNLHSDLLACITRRVCLTFFTFARTQIMLQLVTCTGLGGPADGTRQFQRYLMPLGLHTNQTSSDTQIGTLIDSSSRKSQLLPSVLMSTDPICQIYIYQTGKKLQDYLGSLDILNST